MDFFPGNANFYLLISGILVGAITLLVTILIKRYTALSASSSNVPISTPIRVLGRGEKLLMKNKLVIVRVWTSQFYERGDSVGHVSVEIVKKNRAGSLSANTYISFYPAMDSSEYPDANFEVDQNGSRWSYIDSYFDDRLIEGRPPEFLFSFYTLDSIAIQGAFRMFRLNSANTWGLLGQYTPKLFSSSSNNSDVDSNKVTKQSCVSLACLCLDAGRINKLMGIKEAVFASSTETSAVSAENSADFSALNLIRPVANISVYITEQLISGLYMSPDVLAGRLKKAKINELNTEEKVRCLGKITCKYIGKKSDKANRKISYSWSDNNVGDTVLQDSLNADNSDIINEILYEWLPE